MSLSTVASLLALSSLTCAAADDLTSALDEIRQRHGVPALAAAAMREGEVVATGVCGVRAYASPKAVTPDDLWHLGSCTKSMTATLAAILVEEGKVRWDTTIGEALPDLRSSLHPDWQKVTLEQLLNHRSGLAKEPPHELWREAGRRLGTPVEQRLTFIRGLLALPPAEPPGTKMIYSNQGYAIVGAMLERAAGQPYEELLQKKLFLPLGIKSAGFGAPGHPGAIDQPLGHRSRSGSFVPIDAGPGADNPPAITPAGRVHCSLADFARYTSWHARGPLRDVKLISDANWTRLHTAPAGQDYAMGWITTERPWAGALMHVGSNTMWYAVMWIVPAKQASYVALTNCAGDQAAKACDEALGLLIRR
jgi:CubicO group peptidase (beta-lactamase class C family)